MCEQNSLEQNSPVDRNPYRSRGFTLVEILIVVVILGILAAMVIPMFTDFTDEATQLVFISDMQTYSTAAQYYMADVGDYLEDSSSGQLPLGWSPYVNDDKWLGGPSIGGVWDFELDSFGIKSAFGVHFNVASDHPGDPYMLKIDTMFDDGNLSTGGFRKIANDRYYFILEG